MQKDYFKGWYFKCSNDTQTIAFIPAFHRSGHCETASLQIMTDDTAFNLPFDSLEFWEIPLSVRIGDSIFSEMQHTNMSQTPVISYSHTKKESLTPFRII